MLAAGARGFNNTGATQIYIFSESEWFHQATLSRESLSAEEGYAWQF